nr:PREDICTED: membrane-spanning 4-domains subfamily A member 14 isoform X1 [Rhinolophus sinicus]
MESSSEVGRPTHVITVQPNETVLTAFPYGPHSSLLNFLKGDPKVLGAVQVLLALVTVGIGAIFAFNYFTFSQRFPLVFLIGYPFWGAFIFIITGYLTGLNRKKKCLGQSVMAMNVISSLVAVAGITFTIISFRYQHQYCQMPSLEGICVIGRILFNIVFFFPSDVTQDSELPVPEETAVIKFELQEESPNDGSSTNIQPVFLGGYTFFKLRVSKNPLTFQCSGKKGSNNYYKSLSVTDEQQKCILPPLKLYEEENKPKSLPAIQEERTSENITYNEQINDEDLQFAVEQPPEMQTQFLQAEALPLQIFPSHSIKTLEALPAQDFPSQVLPTQTLPIQALLSETQSSHVTQSHSLISKHVPSQDTPPQHTQSQDIPSSGPSSKDTPSQNLPSQDIPSQDTLSHVQVLLKEAMLFEAQTSNAVQSLNVQYLEQQSLNVQLQNIQQQDQQFMPMLYQDIQSEVDLLTQEWKSEEKLQSRQSLKQHSLGEHSKGWQSPRRKSLDQPIQGQQSPKRKSLDLSTQRQQSPKRKSLDQPIQGQHSLKRKSLDLSTQHQHSPKRKSLDLPTQRQHSPKRKSLDLPTQRQPSPKRKSLDLPIQGQESPRRKSLGQCIKAWLCLKRDSIDKEGQVQQTTQQPPDQQAEDQLDQEEESLKQQSQNGQGEDQQGKEEQSPKEQSKEDQQANQEESPKEQTQHQQAENLLVQEKKSPMQLGQHQQSQIQGCQDRQSPREQSLDLKTQNWPSLGQQSQGWRNKDYKARECQFEVLHSLNWGSQDWQTQDLLEKEYLKQKALYQEAQTVHDLCRYHRGWQRPDILFQDPQYQEKDQKDLRSTGYQKEDLQTKDIKLGEMKSLCQNPRDLQSENMKPDFHHSSCQSSAQDLYFTCVAKADSDARRKVSVCSPSHKKDLTLTSCYAKDQQQSEDSD